MAKPYALNVKTLGSTPSLPKELCTYNAYTDKK